MSQPRSSPAPSAGVPPYEEDAPPAVVLEHVEFAFDEHVVLRDVTLTIPRGSMTILLGASGAGKSILLKIILGLLRPDAGKVVVHGARVDQLNEVELLNLRGDIGMLFQESALFDSLTVAENVGYRLYEESDAPPEDVRRRVEEVLGFVGLEDHIDKMPSELSGGQRRRVAIARAMASKPRLVLLDDPTTGLDPITATTIDDQIVKLRDLEQVTSLVVTHQMRDAVYISDHQAVCRNGRVEIVPLGDTSAQRSTFMVLHEGRIYFQGTTTQLLSSSDPYLKELLYMTLPPW
jgi:phospholipid/cholesterol/gamma-HCH transport system ATP-binding protein